MDELDQLAFDIQAFLFQNIFDVTLQNDGTLIQGNKVYCHQDKDGTVLPVVVKPALCDYQGMSHEISLFCNIREKNGIIEECNPFLPNLFLRLQIRLKSLPCYIEDKNNTLRTIYHHLGMHDIALYFIQPNVIISESTNISINALSELEKRLFSKDNLLRYLPFDIYYDENKKEITTLIRNTNTSKIMTNRSLNICFLLNIVNCILKPLCKFTKNDFFPPSKTILELSPEKISKIQNKSYITQNEYNEQFSCFSFREYKYTTIQLSSTSEAENSNFPVVAQSREPSPVVSTNPNYLYSTQVLSNPYFFLPTQYGNQYFPSYSYQNIPSLIVTIPPINQRTVNYELTYKWINEQYTKTNHKDQFESELLFLYRVEFELLKKIKLKEDIHPFNLDRPLFTIFSNTPEDISKNKPHAIQLRPFDFYSYKLNDLSTTIYDTLSEQQKEIISISYALENPSQLYSQEAEKFKQMNAWGTLYLLHYLLYQQTEKVEHDWESMIAIAQEVAERFAISTDEVERHIIPEDINDERLYNLSPIDNRGDFSDAMEITPKERTGKNDEIYGKSKFAFFIGDKGQSYYHALKLPNLDFFIPEIFVSVSYLDFPVPMLLPPKIHHLFHEECISQHDGELCITSDLSKAAYSKDWISWWGGEKTLDKVDMTILQGKDIAYICNGFEDFELSLKVCARMKEYGAKPKIHYDKKDYHENEFFTLANQLGYENDMHGFMESQQPQKQSGTKIEIIKEYFSTRELILLLGEAKVGKTFVGLSLALSIASQTPMNDYWIPNEQFKGDIYYCFGEMDDNDIAERIKTLAEHMELCITSHETENSAKKRYSLEKTENKERSLFTVDLRNLINGQFDMTLPEHQQALNNILNVDANNGAFTVFDNYVSILGGSTSIGDAKFNTAFTYFMTLMDKGACVMLAHHTNSEKEIAASKQIERKVDGVIRLTTNNIIEDEIYQYAYQLQRKTPPDILPEELRNKLYKRYCNKGLNVFVTYLYFRDKALEGLIPLHMTLDLKNEGSKWECEEISPEEIIETIIDNYGKNRGENPNNSDNYFNGSGDYDSLKKMNSDQAKQDIYKTVLEACNGDFEKATKMSLKDIARLYGKTDGTFAFHVGRKILQKTNRATIKEIYNLIKTEDEKAHKQQ